MSYFIYSHEPIPHIGLMAQPRSGYNPEYIRWAGQCLIVPEKKWTKLPDYFTTVRHTDWRDRQGTEYEIPIKKFQGIINSQFAERGVVFLDHEPSDAEKASLEALSKELNDKWRARAIEWYEAQRQEKQSGNPGRLWPTAYEQECYELLGVQKPYSVEAFKALREPGGEAAKRIAEAVSNAMKSVADSVRAGYEHAAAKEAKPLTKEHLAGEQKAK